MPVLIRCFLSIWNSREGGLEPPEHCPRLPFCPQTRTTVAAWDRSHSWCNPTSSCRHGAIFRDLWGPGSASVVRVVSCGSHLVWLCWQKVRRGLWPGDKMRCWWAAGAYRMELWKKVSRGLLVASFRIMPWIVQVSLAALKRSNEIAACLCSRNWSEISEWVFFWVLHCVGSASRHGAAITTVLLVVWRVSTKHREIN